ncbi:hypothetical protein ACIQCR_17065 [Streptomyces sp. NPDC093249]|uniref:hypothetical protein n=1 Tax=unclassified Streptomyces TaxID=2593676 RepID=UPI00344FB96D
MLITGRFEDGSTYQALVTGDSERPVIGSVRAAALVELHMGEPVLLSSTGPLRTVRGSDRQSVLALFRGHTTVLSAAP